MEELAKKAQLQADYEFAHTPSIRKILKVVKEFIQESRVLCYGGTAINNLLPKEDQFYDSDYVVPDYDFYSEEPQLHALRLADRFDALGFTNVEVKPGMHLMTFKVFVDFTGVADITYLETPIFTKLWDENLVKDKIHYVTPNFLRMSMYLELSRPRGDVSRWTKVYDRLMLLNKHYPVGCDTKKRGDRVPLSDTERTRIEKVLKTEPVVLIGFHAAALHAKRRNNTWNVPIDLLVTPDTFDTYVNTFADILGGEKVKIVEQAAYAELLPRHVDLIEIKSGFLIVRLFESFACHSYHQLRDGIKVASIPTLLQFFFGFVYADAHFLEGYDADRIVCISQRLVDIAHGEGKRRFVLLTPLDCIGHQTTFQEIKAHKSELYKNTPKRSPEFLRLFFSYTPGKFNKTQKRKIRDSLRRTMRNYETHDQLVTDTEPEVILSVQERPTALG